MCLGGRGGSPGASAARVGRPIVPGSFSVSPDYPALAEAAAARPGWKAVATPERTGPECSRAMVGGKKAVGSCRMERRASGHRHRGAGSC